MPRTVSLHGSPTDIYSELGDSEKDLRMPHGDFMSHTFRRPGALERESRATYISGTGAAIARRHRAINQWQVGLVSVASTPVILPVVYIRPSCKS